MFGIKRINPDLPLPHYQTRLSAGMDLYLNESSVVIPPYSRVVVKTGIAVSLPPDYEAQIRPRSGLSLNKGLTVLNSPGTIDADYRGEICVILYNASDTTTSLNFGDRIAQMVISPIKRIDWEEVEELDNTDRSKGGFGSTGV